MEQLEIDQMLEEKGFIEETVDPKVRLVDEINRLKKEKNAVIPGQPIFMLIPLHTRNLC